MLLGLFCSLWHRFLVAPLLVDRPQASRVAGGWLAALSSVCVHTCVLGAWFDVSSKKKQACLLSYLCASDGRYMWIAQSGQWQSLGKQQRSPLASSVNVNRSEVPNLYHGRHMVTWM